ncbi:MAG: class I mannose-6-phosphate isomerase [Bacteroidales bacterium]|nr:class I mannose-6-phosphate isomerase [Candidatus Physcousia equi]
MSQLYPFLFTDNLHQVVWGSEQIGKWKGLQQAPPHVGESWEVSAIETSPSVVANGPLQGTTLPELVAHYGQQLLGKKVSERYGGKFPLLAKFIGAASDLSIQVHPDDALALKRHNCFGKNEMWYIINALPGAKIYSGFKTAITPEAYKSRVADGTICDVLQAYEVHPGDIFYIPAGRVHAICGGILLAEVQQSSDVTYRIFDYNRPGLDGLPRPLHTDLALDALDFRVEEDYQTHYSIRPNRPTHVVCSPFFQLNLLDLKAPVTRHLRKCDSFVIYMCTQGDCRITPESSPDDAIVLSAGHSCLIPAQCADLKVQPHTSTASTLVEAFIDNYRSWSTTLIKNVASIIWSS